MRCQSVIDGNTHHFMPAIWKYYLDTTLFNLGFSTLIGLYTGPLWAFIIFATFGTAIGFLGYAYFREQEYYFYYNLGYTKRALMVRTWIINLVLALIGLVIYGLFATLLS